MHDDLMRLSPEEFADLIKREAEQFARDPLYRQRQLRHHQERLSPELSAWFVDLSRNPPASRALTCQAEDAGALCGRPEVWQHPTDYVWLCDNYAPPAQDRARCEVNGKLGAPVEAPTRVAGSTSLREEPCC